VPTHRRHAPEARTPRPAARRDDEAYEFNGERWHPALSAAPYINVSVRKLRALRLPNERYVRTRVWRESVLDEYLRQRASEPAEQSRQQELATINGST
jgi:hypothetical protein